MFPCSNFKCPFTLHFMIYPRATEPYPCPLAVSPPALDAWAPSLLRSSWFLQAGISTSIHLHQNKSHDEEFSHGQLRLAEGAFFFQKIGYINVWWFIIFLLEIAVWILNVEQTKCPIILGFGWWYCPCWSLLINIPISSIGSTVGLKISTGQSSYSPQKATNLGGLSHVQNISYIPMFNPTN